MIDLVITTFNARVKRISGLDGVGVMTDEATMLFLDQAEMVTAMSE